MSPRLTDSNIDLRDFMRATLQFIAATYRTIPALSAALPKEWVETTEQMLKTFKETD